MTQHERQAWKIGIVVFVTLFVGFGVGYANSPVFFLPLLKEFHCTRAHLSWVFACSALAMAVSATISGSVLDRVDARIVMSVGAALLGFGLIGAGNSKTYGELFASYLVVGVGGGASLMVPCALLIANWFSERRGTALGVATAGEELGGMVLTVAIGYLIAAYGWRTSYVIIAIPMLLLILPIALIVRTRPGDGDKRSIAESAQALDGFEVGEALRTRAFWMLVAVNFLYCFALAGTYVHLVAYQVSIGYSMKFATWMIGVFFFFGTIGKALMGVLGDRIGGRYALTLGFVSMTLGMLALLGARNELFLILFMILAGGQMALGVGLVPFVLAETLGLKRFGTLFGMVSFTLTAGNFVGSPILGRIYDVTGSYKIGFELCAVFTALAAVASFLCVPPRKRKAVAPIVAAAVGSAAL